MLLFWHNSWAGKWNVIPDTPWKELGSCTTTAMKLNHMVMKADESADENRGNNHGSYAHESDEADETMKTYVTTLKTKTLIRK